MFCARRVCFYGSVGAVALDVRQSLRFCSGHLRSMCVSPCGFVRGICARCASVPAVLPGRWFALGARPALRLCRGVWPRFTPVFFPLSGKKRRLAGCCVPIPPWVEIAGSAFSWCRCGYLPWRVHFGFVRFFMAISTGNRGHEKWGYGRTGDGVGGGAECAFALPHWLCCAFRREYVGAARPKPAPKSLRLSGLSSGAGRVRKCVLRGGVALVRVRRAVIRALSET